MQAYRVIRSTRALCVARSTMLAPSMRQQLFSTSSVLRDIKEISYAQLKPLTEQPSLDRTLIDVREVHEVEQGSIPSAVNVPLSVLPGAFSMNPDDFRNKFGFEIPSKSQEVIFYCRSGKRSTTASEVAQKEGYTNIKNYTGSWLDWVEKEQKQSS